MAAASVVEKVRLVLSSVPPVELIKLFMNLSFRTNFEIHLKDGSTTHNINIPFLQGLRFKTKLFDEKAEIFEWDINGRKVYGTNDQMAGFFYEYHSGELKKMYGGPAYKGSVVLDIGGHIGDSALLFLEEGAKRVIVYEPVPINVRVLQLNLKGYKKVEIITKAVCDRSHIVISSSVPPGDMGFGSNPGKYRLEVECETLDAALRKWSPNIVKMDCEGCEAMILTSNPPLISKVPYWVIETHNLSLKKSIEEFMDSLGFKKTKEFELTKEVHLLHFKLSSKAPSTRTSEK